MTGLTGLLKIELPAGDALLTDGGVTEYNGDTYTVEDATLGSLSGIETIAEGIGQEIPALDLSFAPQGIVGLSALSTGAIQQSTVSLYLAEYDTDTGLVVGTPELRFIGFVDQPQISVAFKQMTISITAVSGLEAMFMNDRGNGLSSAFHKSLYAGETGHDNATGMGVPIAWGTASATIGYATGGGSYRGIRNNFQVDHR